MRLGDHPFAAIALGLVFLVLWATLWWGIDEAGNALGWFDL